jgi:hypothetical protein
MTTFCLSEDRPFDEPGLRIALRSIGRHCPGSRTVVYRKDPTGDFAAWVARQPSVTLVPYSPPGASSWNCKPHALLPLLRSGEEEVVWLDADVVLARDPRPLFAGWDELTLGICEEYAGAPHPGSEPRTRGWGFPVGRSFPRTLNSAVLRVTPAHAALLERWRVLLDDPRYRPWQARPLHERPLHAWGDQDVLNALLGSAEWAHIPVRVLRTGRDVIHCSSATSYTAAERLAGAFGPIPPIIHCQGAKPWVVLGPGLAGPRAGVARRLALIHELSPYSAVARTFRDEIGMASGWMGYRSLAGRIARIAGLGHFALRGLPLAAAAGAAKGVARMARRLAGKKA